jgi:hypothetical protein
MIIENLAGQLFEKVVQLEAKAYTNLIISNFAEAEKLYSDYYTLLRTEEEKLPKDKKYHKGTPLHNWGIALIYQNKMTEGFGKIILAYIEDLLNFQSPEDAFGAPAYKTLESNAIIDKGFLKALFEISKKFREENRVPKNPEEIITEYRTVGTGQVDISASLSIKNTDKVPVIKALNPTIETSSPDVAELLKTKGSRDKLVFIGGSHQNIALLRGIRDIVSTIADFKPVLVSEFKLNLNEHDKSMEFLKGCSHAIFEISISNGHLMEIERACDFENQGKLKFVLLYQGLDESSNPTTTKMLLKFEDHMKRYVNLTELDTKVRDFLSGN